MRSSILWKSIGPQIVCVVLKVFHSLKQKNEIVAVLQTQALFAALCQQEHVYPFYVRNHQLPRCGKLQLFLERNHYCLKWEKKFMGIMRKSFSCFVPCQWASFFLANVVILQANRLLSKLKFQAISRTK